METKDSQEATAHGATNPMRLDGRTVIVTGAAGGIGLEIVKLCITLGARVVLVDRNREAVEKILCGFPAEQTLSVCGDVASEEFAADCMARSLDRFGAVDGLVNNAGIIRPALLEKLTLQDWSDVIEINLTGPFLMTREFGKVLIERVRDNVPQPAGSTAAIVNISSTAGKKGSIGQANYSAAKSGLFGLTMTTALEWAKYGIRCNSVGFGPVITAMTEVLRSEKFAAKTLARVPLGRFAEPQEAAGMVVFLLSDAARYITGENLTVSGGMHMQP